MAFLVSALLPLLACVVLIVGTSAVWWRSLHAPWLFVVVGFLALLGLHRVVQLVVELVKVMDGRGYFLETPVTATTVQLVEKTLTAEALAISAVVMLLGFLMLLWLKRALPALLTCSEQTERPAR